MSWVLLTSHFIDMDTEAQRNELVQNDTEVKSEPGFKHQQSGHQVFLFLYNLIMTLRLEPASQIAEGGPERTFPVYCLAGKHSINSESCIIQRLDYRTSKIPSNFSVR